MTATISDESIAQPGQAGTRAQMAFQGPDTNVKLGVDPCKPRRIEFAEPPAPIKEDAILFPTSLKNRAIQFGMSGLNGGQTTYSSQAEDYGLHWVRITHKRNDGSPGAVVGMGGQILNYGDEVQLPGNVAAALAMQGSAVFLFSGADKAELDFIEKAKKLGYVVEAPRVKAEDRPEYDFLKKKKKGWMAGTFDPTLGERPIG